MVTMAYHQLAGEQPASVENRSSRCVSSDEQPYVRQLTGKNRVGEAWQPVDCGWLEEASLVSISNEEGKGLQKIPTAAEAAETAARVIEIGVANRSEEAPAYFPEAVIPVLVVLPGESVCFSPASLASLRMRCRSGEAKVNLVAFPI